jgi:hypothetical protein
MKIRNSLRLCVSAVILVSGSILSASSTTTWEMNSYQDFIRGRFQGISLTRDGRLALATKVESIFSSDQPVVWSIAPAPDGSLYVATGHRGRLFRIDKSGKSAVIWTAEQPEIFAVAVDAQGAVYAATSPDGKIYRIDATGKAEEYFAPQSKYIWSLAVAPNGVLYAGTGDQGRVYRIDRAGHGEVYYATGQSHVTGLAIDREGRVLAGTEPNGILYRISAKDKAFALYNAGLPEIRAISPAPDGSIYAVAMGGSLAKRGLIAPQTQPAQPAGAVVTATGTSITVTAESAQAGPEIKPQPEPAKPPAPAQAPVTTTFTPAVDVTGIDKSAIYKINRDNTVETLWTSKEENVYDLLPWKGQLLFATDANGRVYRLSADRKLTLITQTNEAEATRLVASGDSILAATGNMGRIYRLEDRLEASGSYEAPVHDAGTVAQWGRITWRAADAAQGAISFRTRTGNSLRPDKTWSDWSAPVSDPANSRVESPNARYIQWKAGFTGAQGKTPVLESVNVAYLPQNTPPAVKSITVVTQLAATGAAKPAQQAQPSVYSITVTDSGDAAPASSPGTPTQTPSRAAAQQINISWQAEDPDGDRLVYTLWFRGEDEQDWKLLKANLHENTYAVDGDAFADGKYFFRVVASDREANPPAVALQAELVSSPVLIDNTPPVITVGATRKTATGVTVEFEAADLASALRHCEYSVDAGPWTPLESLDGVIDSPRDKFLVRLEHLPPGEHVLVLRAVDSATNAGLAKVVLR